jgi:hypothetical protein
VEIKELSFGILCDFIYLNVFVGLAEAGLISSKLSRSDMNDPDDVQNYHNLFLPER